MLTTEELSDHRMYVNYKPRMKVKPVAHCTNTGCAVRNGNVREVDVKTIFCPKCNHALFWTIPTTSEYMREKYGEKNARER